MSGTKASRAGFTLIEMITVLLILSILAGVFLMNIGATQELVDVRLAQTQLGKIGVALAEYEVEEGDYPPSHFDVATGPAPNLINLGIERMVVALWTDGLDGCGLDLEDVANVDGDRTAARLCDLPTTDLFELVDVWGNPIAYFHHTDYEREDLYQTFDTETGVRLDTKVRAVRNPTTQLYYNHRKFQLISAGPDGRFGTEDDLTSFKR